MIVGRPTCVSILATLTVPLDAMIALRLCLVPGGRRWTRSAASSPTSSKRKAWVVWGSVYWLTQRRCLSCRALRGFRDAHPDVGLTPAEADYLRWMRAEREVFTLRDDLAGERLELRLMTVRHDRLSSVCGQLTGQIRALELAGSLDAQQLQHDNARLRQALREQEDMSANLRFALRESVAECGRVREDLMSARRERLAADRRAAELARRMTQAIGDLDISLLESGGLSLSELEEQVVFPTPQRGPFTP